MPQAIHGDDVMPLLLVACPSFTDAWKEIKTDHESDSPGESRLHYLDAGVFARQLVDQFRAGNTTEVSAAFGVIERLHVEGDAYVRQLATIGYLEGLLDLNHPDQFNEYLGPESQRWWNGLVAFWTGEIPEVQAIHSVEPPRICAALRRLLNPCSSSRSRPRWFRR